MSLALARARSTRLFLIDLATRLSVVGMGPTVVWSRPRRGGRRAKLAQLVLGVTLIAVGVALLLAADLGAAPWDVLASGLARRTRLPLPVVMWGHGVLMLTVGVLSGQRPRWGTAAPVVLCGPIVGAVLGLVGTPTSLLHALALLVTGIVTLAVGAGMYLTAGCGVGPIDLVFSALAERGVPMQVARLTLDGAALVGGWLLGGRVGVGTAAITVLLAFLIPATCRLFDRHGIARVPEVACATC